MLPPTKNVMPIVFGLKHTEMNRLWHLVGAFFLGCPLSLIPFMKETIKFCYLVFCFSKWNAKMRYQES